MRGISRSGWAHKTGEVIAANLMRPMQPVQDGKVVTRDGVANVIRGMAPAQLPQSTVKTIRGHGTRSVWEVVPSVLDVIRPIADPTLDRARSPKIG